MGRREVIEIECDRCGRVQTQGKTEVFDGEGPEFVFTLRGKKTSYDDLCKACRRTITNYIERVLKVTADEKPAQKSPKSKEKGNSSRASAG